jgi:electron transport complex protein RnfG
MSKLRYFVQQSWLLLAGSFCFGLLIAMTNAALSGRIEQNKAAKLNDLTKALMPGAERFQLIDADIEVKRADGSQEKARIFEIFDGANQRIGWSFTADGSGFAGPVELVIAVDRDFQKILGLNVLVSSETPGFGDQIKGDYYRKQYAGAPAEALTLVKTGDPTVADAQIVAITGATVSSEAVVGIVNRFVTQIKSQMQEKGLVGHVRQ